MKKLNIITALTVVLILIVVACNKDLDLKIIEPPCTFNYSAWAPCSNNIQTREYTSNPSSGCTGMPPADSIERPCVIKEVLIGNQIWTSTNLDVITYRNGETIPQVQDLGTWTDLTTGAWCYYANNTANGTTYGKLYNWFAVKDPRGLAPNGYHIPTDAEWTTLTNYLGGEYIAGTKMKSTSGWQINGNGTNSSGFAGLPGGYRDYYGDFFGIGAVGYWWSSSEFNSYYAWSRGLSYGRGDVDRGNGSKRYGFSVRCLRD